MEVLPNHHGPGVEGVEEHLLDELLGPGVGPGLVELDDVAVVEAGGLQQFELLL